MVWLSRTTGKARPNHRSRPAHSGAGLTTAEPSIRRSRQQLRLREPDGCTRAAEPAIGSGVGSRSRGGVVWFPRPGLRVM